VPSRQDPATSLADILENLERIEGYVAGLDREGFRGDTLRRDAVERCLESICEAAFRLGEKAAELVPSQPWGDIRVWATDCATLTTVLTLTCCGTPFETGCRA
jgi:uncharacterized protein with HEPN domain